MNGAARARFGNLVFGLPGALAILASGSSLHAQAPTSSSAAAPKGSAEPAVAQSTPPPLASAESGAQAPAEGTTPPIAESPATAPPRRADALALTVSGAVSLGSHEAGQLFLLTEALRKSPGSTPLRVTTGASAGSANALFSASEACLRRDFTAEESIGYRAWVNVGLDELFDPKRTTRQSIFHVDSIERSLGYLDEVWKKGLPPDCDFAYGVAVTRKSPSEMKVAEGLVIPRSAERFIVRVEGRESGPPQLTNYVDAKTTHNRPLLPFTGVYAEDTAALEPVVLASAAFPVAFPAQPIEYCIEDAGDSDGQCTEATQVDLFVDGGVFDNNPLGIAYRTARAGLERNESGASLRKDPDGTHPEEVDVVYGYVDPDLRTYPLYTPPPNEDNPDDDPVLSLVTSLGGQMLASARGHELGSLADENFALLQDLWLIKANYPPMSELLGAFFGFFERDFRDFDFHLGTYDAFVDLRDRSAARLGVDPYIEGLDKTLRGDLAGVPKRYRKLACVASQVGPKAYHHLKGACQGKELRNFRVLLQVAIDRLWSNCRLLSAEQVKATDHVGCKQARGGLPPPLVDPSFSVEGARFQGRQESPFDYTLRLLSDYGFHFVDLDLDPDDARHARVAIRRKLIAMVEALSAAQGSFLDRTAVMTAGRTLINGIYYEPPQKRAYVGIGSSIFAGYIGRLGGLRMLYWNPDARMMNMRDLLSNGTYSFTAQASLGLEVALLPLSGTVLQSSFGARGGYQFAAADGIGLDPCVAANIGSDSRRCSGPVIHAPVNFTLLERVRLSITPVFYPLPQDFGHQWFELEVGIAAELY